MPAEAETELLHSLFKEASHQRESALFGVRIFVVTEVLFSMESNADYGY